MKARDRRVPAVHICHFASIDHLRGRKRTYEAIKEAALAAGRFSIFDIETQRDARLFDQLERDPEVETYRNPPGYPWIGIRRKGPRGSE